MRRGALLPQVRPCLVGNFPIKGGFRKRMSLWFLDRWPLCGFKTPSTIKKVSKYVAASLRVVKILSIADLRSQFSHAYAMSRAEEPAEASHKKVHISYVSSILVSNCRPTFGSGVHRSGLSKNSRAHTDCPRPGLRPDGG